MTALRTFFARPYAVWLLAAAAALIAATLAPADDRTPPAADLPALRRVLVPADRPQVWPPGDWQPVALSDLERQFAAARAASRDRPATFLEQAEYSATLVDSGLHEGRLEWSLRRPDPELTALSLGRFNLNVRQLGWNSPIAGAPRIPAVWGTAPEGNTALIVNRTRGKLTGDWSLPGRRLAASTEFDVELAPAALSRLTLRVPAGLMLTSTAGDLSPPVPAGMPGWNEWRLNLGSQTTVRIRVAPPSNGTSARPLLLVRNNLNYVVKSEEVRVLAEFDFQVLEAAVRELRLLVDPEIQVTSVEYGDDGVVAWKAVPSAAGPEIVVQLPDPVAGEGNTLQVQGIAQVKQFVPWTLPRIRLSDSVDAVGQATLRLQSPLLASDIRTDGYRQTELSADADEGELLVFRQLRGDGTITIVPADSKPDLTCRAVTLIQPDRHQWSMVSQWEWTAATGNTFATACQISGLWEIVDVRPVAGEGSGNLTGWEVQETEPGHRVLHLFFLNAFQSDRPQRVRIAARRLPPAGGEHAVVPPLVPLDAGLVEQTVVVSTSSELRPVVEDAQGIEFIALRELPADARTLDFLSSRLAESGTRSIAFRARGTVVAGRLRVVPVEPPRDLKAVTPLPAAMTDRAPAETPASAASVAAPVSLEVSGRITGLATGYDHYTAKYRMQRLSKEAVFAWRLPALAELLAVTIDGRRVVPQFDEGTYTLTALPAPADAAEAAREAMIVSIEYRVGATTHAGPNSRPLLLPDTDRPVLNFELALHLAPEVRLADPPPGLSPAGFDDRLPWYRSLPGPFSRVADQPGFNPLRLESWPALFGADRRDFPERETEQIWRATAARPPVGAQFMIWNSHQVQWLSWVLFFLFLLAGAAARFVEIPFRRGSAIVAAAGFSLGTLLLSPVVAELTASALIGIILSILLPRRALRLARRCTAEESADVPVGSTQSFIPISGLLLVLAGAGLALTVEAQEPRAPAPAGKLGAPTSRPPPIDVLVPVGPDGKPAGETPVAYVPTGLMPRLKRLARPAELPAWLIAASTFDAAVDETDRLPVTARFEIHVLAGDPAVPVHLPLGVVNLGGSDACLLDGRPHPVSAGPSGRGLIIELPGAEPLPVTPPVPELERVSSRTDDATEAPAGLATQPFAMRTCAVTLHLHPAVDAGRSDVLVSSVGIPSGCQTRATLSAQPARPVVGMTSAEAGLPSTLPASLPATTVFEPGPTRQLVFYWSATRDAAPAQAMAPPKAEVQAGISCLADVSTTLIHMRYHVAYRVGAGRIDALTWHVPAGYVLENVQAPQLAGFRFEPGEEGGRRMLIEFSRPQAADFSLAATFALAVDWKEKQIPLPLLDPVRAEDGRTRQTVVRFHQIALRQPAELRANLSVLAGQLPLKPRPVDDFLKEWNAAGARPQQAFDLERNSLLTLALDPPAGEPGVRALSIARFHPDHLDWSYTAEISQPPMPQFLYRLHVDPRLRIRSVSVQEDDAERLLRWSQVRENLVVFLNDGATRAQSIRIEATMPLSPPQVIDLPRIRFAAATPGPERVTLFRDARVTVRLANPEDFPVSPAADAGTDARGDRLVARLDVLPEQANPRINVDPVLPQVTARAATVLDSREGTWRFTMLVNFQVAIGRVTEFAVDLPEAVAAACETLALPPSRVLVSPPAGGRTTLTFYPDEPGLREFVAVFSGVSDVSRPAWRLPDIHLPAAELTSTVVVFPPGSFELLPGGSVAEAVAVPEWVADVLPAGSSAAPREAHRWPAGTVIPDFRPTRDVSSKPIVETARYNLWLDENGTVLGRLGLKLSGSLPQNVEFDWPATAVPTGLFIDGAVCAPPVPADGVCSIALPPAKHERTVWFSWVDSRPVVPALSGPLSARLPWPRLIPVEICRVNVHPPRHFRVDVTAPFRPVPAGDDPNLLPAALASAEESAAPYSGDVSLVTATVPEPGKPFDLGISLRLVNLWPLQVGLRFTAALLVAILMWKAIPVWTWLTRSELVSWLVLCVFWWLCLTPAWLGPAIGIWGGLQTMRRRTIPTDALASASTAHAPPAT